MIERTQSLLLVVMAVLIAIYIAQVIIERYKKKPIKKDASLSIKPALQTKTTPNILIKCKDCGEEISPKAKVCLKCGAPVPNLGNALMKLGCSLMILGPVIILILLIITAWLRE